MLINKSLIITIINHNTIPEFNRKLSEAQEEVIAEESEAESFVTRDESQMSKDESHLSNTWSKDGSQMSNTFSYEFTKYSEDSVSVSDMSLPPPHTSMVSN